jgi:hypothetical protein
MLSTEKYQPLFITYKKVSQSMIRGQSYDMHKTTFFDESLLRNSALDGDANTTKAQLVMTAIKPITLRMENHSPICHTSPISGQYQGIHMASKDSTDILCTSWHWSTTVTTDTNGIKSNG